jgi:dolichol-phosphate mannosyltransferase
MLVELCGKVDELETEFIFVDDGSSDSSLEIIKKLPSTDASVKYVKFSNNFGQVTAIVAGLQKAKGDAVVIRSADLQDPVSLIHQFIEGWQAGNQMVVAHRNKRSDGLVNRMQSALYYKAIRTVSPKMPKGGFDYCLLDRKVVDALNRFKHRNRFLQGDVLSLGFSTQFVPYERLEDSDSRKTRSFSSNVKYSIDGILDSTYLPIRFMSLMGVLSLLGGIGYSAVIVIARITDNVPFDGWAPLMILILLIGGMLMLMMGIMGEYVWRIYDQLKERPQFIIEEESD